MTQEAFFREIRRRAGVNPPQGNTPGVVEDAKQAARRQDEEEAEEEAEKERRTYWELGIRAPTSLNKKRQVLTRTWERRERWEKLRQQAEDKKKQEAAT